MTRLNKKDEEVYRVRQLQRALGDGISGTIENAEEPDIIVAGQTKRIGIEVTELHQRSDDGNGSPRQQESERAGIVRRARDLAIEGGTPVVDVAVHFTEAGIAKKDRETIAAGVVTLVNEHLPEPESSYSLELWREGYDLPWIRAVRIFRTAVLTKHHWWSSESGWVQTDFKLELQEAIDDKNLKHSRYLERCDECWLLVTASGGRPSGFFELAAETREHVYRSAFARTFFLDVFGDEVVELSTLP